jgi:hypothetical protein
MRALTKFDISGNSLCAAGVKVLAEALRDNQVMTEINIANNKLGKDKTGFRERASRMRAPLDMSGVAALANVIPGMEALSTFTFSGDYSSSQPVTMETTMTEAEFSGKELGVSGGMMVAAFLPKCQ